MIFTKENLTLEEGLNKEWLITNGIGGYASSTIIGINTRKYHGLLIAPLTPPARRFLILSKLDEALEIEGKEYNFYSNICQNYISKGFEYQEKFEKVEIPIFSYKIEDILIEKSICMEYGKNTVGVLYKIKNGNKDATLKLTPVINYRDFHTMNTDHNFKLRQDINKNKIKMVIDENSWTPIYMKTSEGTYQNYENNIFSHMFYIEEEKRGFYPEENHIVPGTFQIKINKNEEKKISFICSLEDNIDEIDVEDLIQNEKNRLDKVFKESGQILEDRNLEKKEELKKQEIMKLFSIAIDNFIVYRPSFGLHTIIAGYPWFLDWGRDTLIAFEGLCLKTKKYEIAKEILLTMIRDIKYGLVPNGYSGFDNRPLYNSVDSSLLLFEQIQKYLEYTNDEKFIKEKLYNKLENIINNYVQGIDLDNNNIYLDKDYLISSGTKDTQNTWMDAKYAGIAVTPRNGKAVEINSLWYNALKIMEELTKKFGKKLEAKKYKELADKCKKSFVAKFYNKRRKCLFDVLGDNKIRPNQLFALSLSYPIINPASEEAKEIIETVEKKLLNKYGLKTLAKGEENYVEVYEGDGFRRDFSYHQGITWPWLLGLYYNSLKNIESVQKTKKAKNEMQEKIEKFKQNIYKTFEKEITQTGCIGSISELYDSKRPFLPKGAIAQAWSVAEIYRIIAE